VQPPARLPACVPVPNAGAVAQAEYAGSIPVVQYSLEQAARKCTCDLREQAAAPAAKLDKRNVETRNSGNDPRIALIKSDYGLREGGSRAWIVMKDKWVLILVSDNGFLGTDERRRSLFVSRKLGRG
jgi:hypothetical protein